MPEYTIRQFLPTLLKQIPGALVLAILILVIKQLFNSNVIIFVLSAVSGLVVYALILNAMKIDEVYAIKTKLLSKLKRNEA